jgi:hypothetical protein
MERRLTRKIALPPKACFISETEDSTPSFDEMTNV